MTIRSSETSSDEQLYVRTALTINLFRAKWRYEDTVTTTDRCERRLLSWNSYRHDRPTSYHDTSETTPRCSRYTGQQLTTATTSRPPTTITLTTHWTSQWTTLSGLSDQTHWTTALCPVTLDQPFAGAVTGPQPTAVHTHVCVYVRSMNQTSLNNRATSCRYCSKTG